MKKKFLLYSLCLLTLITCKSGSTEIERLTLSPSSTIQDSLFTQLPGSLILCNNYLVWEDPFNPNYFLHVVDINAKKEIGTMGLIGRGPKEFITPLSISSIGNKIFTYDLNQNKQAYYSIDSMLANKDPFILLPSYPIDDCLDITQISDNEFIYIYPQKNEPLQWIHSISSISSFGNCPIKEELNSYYAALQGTIKYNPYNHKLIYCTRRFPYIALYEKKDTTFYITWEKKSSQKDYKIEKGEIHFTDNNEVPSGITMTKDYIIILQQDNDMKLQPIKQTGGIRDLSKVPNTIFVYDYNFNLKKIINMGMPILRVAAKGDSNTLYAIGIDLDFCIVTYEI